MRQGHFETAHEHGQQAGKRRGAVCSTYGKVALLLKRWLLEGLLLERWLVRIRASPGISLVRTSRVRICVEGVEAPRWRRPLQRALVILSSAISSSLDRALRALGVALFRLFPFLLLGFEQERHGGRWSARRGRRKEAVEVRL